jgi:hypothetical protein
MTFIGSPTRLNVRRIWVIQENLLSGKGPLDGHAGNRPESPTIDGKADKMIAGRQYGHSATIRTIDQSGQRRRPRPISILFRDGSYPVLA